MVYPISFELTCKFKSANTSSMLWVVPKGLLVVTSPSVPKQMILLPGYKVQGLGKTVMVSGESTVLTERKYIMNK